MEDMLDLQELFEIIKKRFLIIVIIPLLATTATGVFTNFFVTPMYQSSTQLVVSRLNNEITITGAEISGTVQLINTFNVIIVSPFILDQVIETLDLNHTAGGLRSRMSVRNERNAQVMTLSVQHEDPVVASKIANKAAEVFEREVPGLMNVDESLVRVLAEAQAPRFPVSPRPMMSMGLAFVIGAMSGLFLTFLLEFLDKTIKTEQDVRKITDIPVLGMIPIMTAKDVTKDVTKDVAVKKK